MNKTENKLLALASDADIMGDQLDDLYDPLDKYDTQTDQDSIDPHDGLYGMGDDDQEFHDMAENEKVGGHLGYTQVANTKQILSDYSEITANSLNKLQSHYTKCVIHHEKLKNLVHNDALAKTKQTYGTDKEPSDPERAKRWREHYDHHSQTHPKFKDLLVADHDRSKAKIALKRATK